MQPSELLVAAADRIRDLAAAAREDIGTKVRVARVAKGLALREVARRIDCAASYLSDIENGHRVPSEAVTRQLAGELGLDPELLLVASGRVALVAQPLEKHFEALFRDAALAYDLGEDKPSDEDALAMARVVCPELAEEIQ